MKVKLSEVAYVQSGMVLTRKEAKPNDTDTFEYRRLTLRSLGDNGKVINEYTDKFISKESLSENQLTQKDDIIIKVFLPLSSTLIDDESIGYVVPSQMAVVKPIEPDKLLPEYLRWYFAREDTQQRMLAEADGITQRTIKIRTIADSYIDVPDVKTQKKIVELDRLYRYKIELQQALIEEEDRYMKYITNTLLEDF